MSASTYTDYTYTVSNAAWVGGGTVSGTFTIRYSSAGTPIAVEAVDLTTTGGSISGYHYVYTAGSVTTTTASIDATQPTYPANEMVVTSGSYSLFIDWQGETPTALYVGTPPTGEYSSESNGTTIRSLSSGGTVASAIACYLEGTHIATAAGDVAVEALRPGDLVPTADGDCLKVRWVGRSVIARAFADPDKLLPVRIRAGALGGGLPLHDLFVSPAHGVLVDGVLANAAALVNGTSIVRASEVGDVFTYFHVELDRHALIYAEGAPAETFLSDYQEMAFDNWDERTAPEDGEELPLPRAKSWRQVPRATRLRLARPVAAERMEGVAAAA